MGFTDALRMVANIRARDTIKEWGVMLMRQHRPANQLDLPEFMQPRVRAANSAVNAKQVIAPLTIRETVSPRPVETAHLAVDEIESLARKLVCAHCKSKITFPEGKFCWNNEKRFGGYQYCREHQALF